MYSISQAVAIVPKTHCLENPESLVEFPNGQGDISTNGSCYPENKKKVQHSEDSFWKYTLPFECFACDISGQMPLSGDRCCQVNTNKRV